MKNEKTLATEKIDIEIKNKFFNKENGTEQDLTDILTYIKIKFNELPDLIAETLAELLRIPVNEIINRWDYLTIYPMTRW